MRLSLRATKILCWPKNNTTGQKRKMGDSLLLTHVHTRDGSRLPASALVTCAVEEADKEREIGERMVLNIRAFTIYERKTSTLQTHSPSGKDSFTSLSLLLGQGEGREMRESKLVSAPVQPHPGPDTHLLLDEKPFLASTPRALGNNIHSCTNLSQLLEMSDGKAAVLWMLLPPPSWGSLWVLPLSWDDCSCLLPPQHHSVSHPEAPAALPPPPCPVLWVSAETASSTAALGANSLPGTTGWRDFPPLSQCVRGRTQLTRSSMHAASRPQQRRDFSFNFSSLPPPHWLSDFVTNVSRRSL